MKEEFILPIVIFIVLLLVGITSYNSRKKRKDRDRIKESLSEINFKGMDDKEPPYTPIFEEEKEKGFYNSLFKPKESLPTIEEIANKILPFVDGVEKNSVIDLIKKEFQCSGDQILGIINSLQDNGLIKTLELPGIENGEKIFHTIKARRKIADDSKKFRHDFGWDFKQVAGEQNKSENAPEKFAPKKVADEFEKRLEKNSDSVDNSKKNISEENSGK